MKHKVEKAEADGWTDWISPASDYRMSCCDCGLVHNVKFRVVKGVYGFVAEDTEAIVDGARVIMKVARNNRATGQIRRYKKEKS